jgi:hypothetical protein
MLNWRYGRLCYSDAAEIIEFTMNRYDVFLSHSKLDTYFVKHLYLDLCAKGLRVWIDETGLPPGEPSWRRTIASAIRESTVMIVLCSPDALNSEWVQKEIEYAEHHEKRVIPVLIRGTERESVPFGYAGVQRVDMRDPRRYARGVQTLVRAVVGRNPFHEFPTQPAARAKTLVNKSTSTRPSRLLIASRAVTVKAPVVRKRWWWMWWGKR